MILGGYPDMMHPEIASNERFSPLSAFQSMMRYGSSLFQYAHFLNFRGALRKNIYGDK